jgi:arylsulfatase A-like enzyme
VSSAAASREAGPAHALGLLLAALVCAAYGCAADPGRPTSLVVITVDTLRADHLGCYGYFRPTSPNIDRFAADAVLFESVFAPAATTLPSHTSLFTGLSPLEHRVVANLGVSGKPFVWSPAMRTMAQLAKEAGFATAAFVSAAPLKRHAGLAAGFDVYDEPLASERKADQTLQAAAGWLARTRERPVFLWVHFYDPHRPLEPPPEHAVFSADEHLERYLAERRVPASAAMEGKPYLAREDIDGYDGEVRYVDDRVGALLLALRDNDLYERSVIVLTSDHGEGLNQHGWPGHGGTHAEQLHVPLVIRFPDPERNRIGRVPVLASTMDILPTALPAVDPALAGRFAQQASGSDMLATQFQARPVLSRRTVRPGREDAGPLYALTTPEWRLLHDPERADQLFDRTRDAFELHDQAGARPEVADALRREAAGLIHAYGSRAAQLGASDASAPAPLDPERLRELEALGYVTQ